MARQNIEIGINVDASSGKKSLSDLSNAFKNMTKSMEQTFKKNYFDATHKKVSKQYDELLEKQKELERYSKKESLRNSKGELDKNNPYFNTEKGKKVLNDVVALERQKLELEQKYNETLAIQKQLSGETFKTQKENLNKELKKVLSQEARNYTLQKKALESGDKTKAIVYEEKAHEYAIRELKIRQEIKAVEKARKDSAAQAYELQIKEAQDRYDKERAAYDIAKKRREEYEKSRKFVAGSARDLSTEESERLAEQRYLEAQKKFYDKQSTYKSELDLKTTKAQENLDKVKNKIELIEKKITEANQKEGLKIGKDLENEAPKLNLFGIFMQSLIDGIKKGISKVFTFKTAIKSLGKIISGVTKTIKTMAKQLITLGGVTKKLGKSFRSISHVLKYMLLRMTFRQVIKNAKNNFDSLIQISDELRESFNKLYNAIIKVGNAFVSAFGPAIQALSPIVANLFNAMSNLLDIMAQLNTVLFLNGDYYYRAKDTALDYAETIEKGGKAAKKSLAPFDKINKLDTNKGGGSTNADDLLSPQDKFEQAPVEEIIKNFVQRFKNALFTGEGTEFGYSIGTWLTEQFAKGVELTDFKKSFSKIAPKIRGLVTILNGIMYGTDWSLLGITIANILNTALASGILLLYTFDFTTAGQSLANIINNIIYGIDWTMVGNTLALAFMQIFNYVGGLLNSINWVELGFSIGEAINVFFYMVDWAKVGSTVNETINKMLDFLIVTLGSVNWFGIAEAIGTFLANVDWLTIIIKILTVIGQVILLAGIVLIDALAGVLASIVKWLMEVVGPVAEMTMNLFVAPFEFLWNLLSAPFKTAWNAIKKLFTGELSPKELGNNIIDGLLEPFSKLKEKLLSPFKTAYNGVLEFFDVHSPSKLLKKLGKFLMQGFNGGMDEEGADMSPMTNIYGDMEEGTITMTDNMLVTWNSFTESLKELWDGIHKLIIAEVNFGVTALNEMIKAMELGMNAAIRSMNRAIRAYNAAAEKTGGGRLSTLSTIALSKIPIPKLATGAVIPPNSEFLAILGDQKHGTNVEAPLETIMEALDRVLDKRGNNSNQPIIIELDDRELGRAIGDIQNRENRRIGSRLVYN